MIELAAYQDSNTCEEVFECIAQWAARDNDTSVFVLWHEDFEDEINRQIDRYDRNII